MRTPSTSEFAYTKRHKLVIIRTAAVLKSLESPKNVLEIQRDTGIPTASVYRILRILKEMGWVRATDNGNRRGPRVVYARVMSAF